MALALTPPRRPVELVRRVPVPIGAALDVFRSVPQLVISSRLEAPTPDGGTSTELGLGMPGGRQIAREVRVGFGRLMPDGDATALPVWWEDAEHPELFPAFDGGLELRPAPGGTELRLAGSSRPPLGSFGRFADGVVGHRIVTVCLETFLGSVAERLVAEAASMAERKQP